ncbi:MAG TPA: hypothetical protein DCS21_06575 [Gammaproteobacteria bacterium]|nr:hypothetical protein [Gammaproteobacteria bacterium]
MNVKISTLFFVAAMASSNLVFAGADDAKWVAQCVKDNQDQGKPAEVVKKYCECMNEKMDDNETQSIAQWEKSHPKEEKECDAKSGWK